ncbi:putative monovalent cation/H+ antiporter subunit D [Desulfovibrio ferrophilus]|uniref:Putative monovalent cation/H+ antiporter subunit D n=1 Tax=Desulfovibrio ferrophilus TaxID=241368 RepID=A0A2Z6B204_9BACT|nr:putative monovalent cation/H+ antiporter subunit D [Desulfovibrio ferrophilus]
MIVILEDGVCVPVLHAETLREYAGIPPFNFLSAKLTLIITGVEGGNRPCVAGPV